MLLPRLALGSLLLTASLSSHAQSAEPAAPPSRFYVGLGAYHSNFQNIFWRQGQTGFRVPMQLTGGYQLRPRLALELGVAYSSSSSTYAYQGISGTNQYEDYSFTHTVHTAAVSALARYALTRQPAHRLQVDALGGFTLVNTNAENRDFRRDSTSSSQQLVPYTMHRSYHDLLLTLGLGLRYRLCSRLALNFDLTTNRNLNHPEVYNGYTGSAALGLRYRFGSL